MGDIWQAARSNNVKRVIHFLDEGIGPDATRWSGVTPLHRAAETNSCHVARALISAGANVNARTAWGWYSPLHLAVQNGHEEVAKVLLEAGARWTILTKRLQSPYDLASSHGRQIEALRIQEFPRLQTSLSATATDMWKVLRASVIVILPLNLLTTNGFIYSPPFGCIGSRTEAQIIYPQQLQQLRYSNLALLCYGRQLPRNPHLRPGKRRNRHLCDESIFTSSKTFPELIMSVSPEYLRVSVARGPSSTTLIIQASYIDPDTRIRRSWTANRSEQDFFALGVNVIGALGGEEERLPGPPRMGSSPAVFEGYLRRLVDANLVTSLPAFYSFIDAPQDLIAQDPVLIGEVIQDAELISDSSFERRGNKQFRSADRDRDRKTGAAVAGAVGGWLVGGPVGAAIGAVTVRVASERNDEVGDVAKGAGAVADAALEKAANLEREYDITGKAGKAVRGATAAAKKVDSDFKVRERAKNAAERAVRAAQKADQELRVRERATEAAKTAERAVRRVAGAATKVEKEHHLKERAGDAFRQLRFRVKRSVEDLERRRQEKDRH